jgi:hypothetical protein
MKSRILYQIGSIGIIAALAITVLYQIHQKHKIWQRDQEFRLSTYVWLYHDTDNGDTALVRQRLGLLVSGCSTEYERQYGQDLDPEFNPRLLAEAKLIRDQFQAETHTQRK